MFPLSERLNFELLTFRREENFWKVYDNQSKEHGFRHESRSLSWKGEMNYDHQAERRAKAQTVVF